MRRLSAGATGTSRCAGPGHLLEFADHLSGLLGPTGFLEQPCSNAPSPDGGYNRPATCACHSASTYDRHACFHGLAHPVRDRPDMADGTAATRAPKSSSKHGQIWKPHDLLPFFG